MDEKILILAAVAVAAGQMALCLLTKRTIFKLIPTLLLVLLIGLCVAGYAISSWTNWGYLILFVLIFGLLLLDGAVWAIYGILRKCSKRKKSQL